MSAWFTQIFFWLTGLHIDSVKDDNPYHKIERNLSLNVLHGILNIAALNMITPFLSIFAMKLGASKIQVALLSSAPAAIGLFAMIPGACLIDRHGHQKQLTYLFMLAHRLFFLALAAVPCFYHEIRAWLFVGLVALMNLPGAISNVAWQSYISKIIPAEHRAEAFAARNKMMNLVGTLVTLTVGILLDHFKFLYGYQIVFALAFVIALAELAVFKQLDGESTKSCVAENLANCLPEKTSFFQRFLTEMRTLLGETSFLRYTIASMIFYFAWQIAWPLFNWYQVKELGANNTWVSILNLMNTGGALFGYGYWVKMSHRHGNLKTLFYATIGIFLAPAVYAVFHNLFIIAGFNLLIGAIFSGVNLALLNVLLEVTPEKHKTTYLAYYNTAITISAVLAPLVGISMLKIMSFQWAFITCAIFRIIGSLSFYVNYRLELSGKSFISKSSSFKSKISKNL